MKNGVHLKSAHLTGRRGHYFSQKPSNGPAKMQRWKANICFHSHLLETFFFFFFFTNAIRPISPSSTAFNQCIKIVWLGRICPMKKPAWKNPLFSFIITDIGETLFSLETSKRLRVLCCCSDTDSDSASASKHTSFLQSVKMTSFARPLLQSRCHNSIMSPT